MFGEHFLLNLQETITKRKGHLMPTTGYGIEILSVHECWNLLAGMTLGRVVTCVDGHPEIFPVNFVVQGKAVLFRTDEGTKLVSAAINNQVVFEVDDHNVAQGWSVIVKGQARILHSNEEIDDAERAHSCRGPQEKKATLCRWYLL